MTDAASTDQSLEEGECSDTGDSQDSEAIQSKQDTQDSQDTRNDTQDTNKLLIDTQEVTYFDTLKTFLKFCNF